MKRATAALAAVTALFAAPASRAGFCDDLLASEPATSVCDAADDPAYDDGWQPGDDGGSGFAAGGWSFDAFHPENTGHDLASSTLNGDADEDGDLDTNGRAWRIHAGSNARIYADRAFAAPLPFATPLTIEIDTDAQPLYGGTGFELSSDPAYASTFAAYVLSTGNWGVVWPSTSAVDTGVPANGEPVRFAFTRIGEFQFRLDVTPRGGATRTVFGGVGNDLSHLRLVNSGGNPLRELFFNKITVPVPGGAAAVGAALASLAACARRRPQEKTRSRNSLSRGRSAVSSSARPSAT